MLKKAKCPGIARALTLASLLTLLVACSTDYGSDSGQLAVVGGTLVDGTGAAATEDASVIVADGKISCAGTREQCPPPDGARVLDADGKWTVKQVLGHDVLGQRRLGQEALVRGE